MIKNIINEKNENNKILLLLNLNYFKTSKCDIKRKHNHMTCIYFHNKSDQRRKNAEIFYNNVLCKNFNKCLNKNNCNYAHNKIEILYHPTLYKKKLCMKFYMWGKCKYENFCFYAHTEEELNVNLIHKFKQNYYFFLFLFKTVNCPLGKIKHNLSTCVYSHNFQDYKRPNLFKINPVKCKNWNNDKNYDYYEKGCSKGINCKYLHGWKEILYHPENYKKKICKNQIFCNKKYICTYLHQNNYKKVFNKKE